MPNDPDVFGEVYLIRNKINGKLYVGQTTNSIQIRWKQHCSSARHRPLCLIDKAIAKHGESSFILETLDRTSDRSSLNERELDWIMKLGAMAPAGYNLRNTAKGQSGWHLSATTKEKLSRALKGSKPSEETCAKMSQAKLGKKLGAEHRAKIAKSNRGIRHCPRKISDEKIEQIRTDDRPGYVIAAELNVSSATISRIKNDWYNRRKRWEI
jgi:group I intron endonuclease